MVRFHSLHLFASRANALLLHTSRRTRDAISRLTKAQLLVPRLVETLPHPIAFIQGTDNSVVLNSSFRNVWRMDQGILEGDSDKTSLLKLDDLDLLAFKAEGDPFESQDWPYIKALAGSTSIMQYVSVIRGDKTRCMFGMAAYPVLDGAGHTASDSTCNLLAVFHL